MDAIAQQYSVCPLQETVKQTQQDLKQLDEVMTRIEYRTSDIEWKHVPLVGSSANNTSRLTYVQQEIVQYLKKSQESNKDTQKVSCWDVSHEFRDAIDVGSVQGLERIKQVFGISS
jgi:hypothetical protein